MVEILFSEIPSSHDCSMYASFLATQPIYDFLGVPEQNGITFERGIIIREKKILEHYWLFLTGISLILHLNVASKDYFKQKRNCPHSSAGHTQNEYDTIKVRVILKHSENRPDNGRLSVHTCNDMPPANP